MYNIYYIITENFQVLTLLNLLYCCRISETPREDKDWGERERLRESVRIWILEGDLGGKNKDKIRGRKQPLEEIEAKL